VISLNLLAIGWICWFAVRGPARDTGPAAAFEVLEQPKKEPAELPAAPGAERESKDAQPAAIARNPDAVPARALEIPQGKEVRLLTTQEIVARSEKSVALINGAGGSGTGFIVGPGLVATNAHVIAGGPIRSLAIHFPSATLGDRGPLRARLRYKDSRRDLAVLTVETQLPPLEMSRSHVFSRGEDVTIIGCPGVGGDVVLKNAVTRGVLSTEIELEGKRFYQLGAAVNAGNSGGPVFNTQGQVIGIVTLKAADKESIGFCIPVEDLLSALEKFGPTTQEQAAHLEKMHDVESIVRRLHSAAAINVAAILEYLASMRQALLERGSLRLAMLERKREIEPRLVELNRKLTGGVQGEVNEHTADSRLSFQVRHDLGGLWNAFEDLRKCAESPSENFNYFLAVSQQSQERFQQQVERINRTLGVNLDE
jgi:S1-C subfamily serine protease